MIRKNGNKGSDREVSSTVTAIVERYSLVMILTRRNGDQFPYFRGKKPVFADTATVIGCLRGLAGHLIAQRGLCQR